MTATRPTREVKPAGVGKEDLIKITLVYVGGDDKGVNVLKGSTIEEVIIGQGYAWESVEVRDNGDLLEANMLVKEGDQLVVSTEGKIEGGSEEEDEDESDEEETEE